MLKKLLAVLLVLCGALGAFAIFVALRPSGYSLERSTVIDVRPARVFAQVNDLASWEAWSPWAKLDPNAKMTLSNPSRGQGAKLTWSGNEQVGEGQMTITSSKPNTMIELEQVFVRPFAGTAFMKFAFAPVGATDSTKVTWRMEGSHNFLGKAMCLFMDMEEMLGKDFERGLAGLKQAAEKAPAEPASTQ